jgi:hypothetical protein
LPREPAKAAAAPTPRASAARSHCPALAGPTAPAPTPAPAPAPASRAPRPPDCTASASPPAPAPCTSRLLPNPIPHPGSPSTPAPESPSPILQSNRAAASLESHTPGTSAAMAKVAMPATSPCRPVQPTCPPRLPRPSPSVRLATALVCSGQVRSGRAGSDPPQPRHWFNVISSADHAKAAALDACSVRPGADPAQTATRRGTARLAAQPSSEYVTRRHEEGQSAEREARHTSKRPQCEANRACLAT